MSGRRVRPCEFCQEDTSSDYVERRNGYCLWYEVYPFNNVISVYCQANDELGEMMEERIDIDMNYCPVCGRKLIE